MQPDRTLLGSQVGLHVPAVSSRRHSVATRLSGCSEPEAWLPTACLRWGRRRDRRRRASSTSIKLVNLCWILGACLALQLHCVSALQSSENKPIGSIESTSTVSLLALLQEAEAALDTNATSSPAKEALKSIESFVGAKTTTSSPTTSAPSHVETTTGSLEDQDDSSSERNDDDVEDCKGISAHEPAEGKKYTDNERLVNLQTCIQGKIKSRLLSATRSGMAMFDKLSLSGGCLASLLSLMNSLGAIKSFAFKFLDASAKIPSGVMYGLLSDFGDFDQCLSIRSNPSIAPEQEADESAYSGKYCLMSVKLNYHVKLLANETFPEGIVPDGILWDELVRNYWTSKSSKGFQIGVCFPSRCTNDDLEQIYKYVAQSYNVIGELISCQDSLDLKQQYTPDLAQRAILVVFYSLLLLTLIGSLLDRYAHLTLSKSATLGGRKSPAMHIMDLLVCFSIQRSWSKFIGHSRPDREALFEASQHLSGLMAVYKPPGRAKEPSTEQTSMSSPPQAQCSQSALSLSIGDDTIKVNQIEISRPLSVSVQQDHPNESQNNANCDHSDQALGHLSGLRLLVIVWITIGHSFLYPSANNYQYYRSIININFTRDSVWFATTNFTLGIDTLLYISGLTFVYKLADMRRKHDKQSLGGSRYIDDVMQLLLRKIFRFWPTYMTVIMLALMVPLLADGPMWPEMVNKRLGQSCRDNWWANLLFVTNFLPESKICLPSSWFISILVQLFIIGTLIMLMIRYVSLRAGLALLATLLAGSCAFSFAFAYLFEVRAPAIKMDESFVMELDETIFRLYTNICNNLGPFLIGMLGGFILVNEKLWLSNLPSSGSSQQGKVAKLKRRLASLITAILIAMIAVLVLSSVFHQEYTRFWSSVYWSLHRVGWATATGYLVHKCATRQWPLLNDLLSLSTFIPISKLILIAYLVYPIFIYVHSGLVRDGLHVSIYNMLNIYITRLVMTFTTALMIHLLVEQPARSIEELLLNKPEQTKAGGISDSRGLNKSHPLLAVAKPVSLNQDLRRVDEESFVAEEDTKRRLAIE